MRGHASRSQCPAAPACRFAAPLPLALGLALGLALPLTAPSVLAANLPDTLTTLSRTGQFVVTGRRPAKVEPLTTRPPNDPERELLPQTLAPSCERVKTELLDVLGLPDRWRTGGGETGKIFIFIEPTRTTTNQFAVTAVPFERGWHFRLSLPPRLTEDLLVRVLTQAVLMELASRHGNTRLGEPPLWLVEGLTQILLANAPEGLTYRPQTRLVADLEVGNRLRRVREQLARRPPLSFHQLSQPDLGAMEPRDWDQFSACAHLCVRELSRLPNGPGRLVLWLDSLQTHWNWQTGFLEAFAPHFRSLLDVEKWWAITVAHATGRNSTHTWPTDFSLRKLDEILQPVGVLPGAGSRAVRLDLEDVIATWDYSRQIPVLQRLLQQLNTLRFHAAGEVSDIAGRYAAVVDEYVDDRRRVGIATARGQPTVSTRRVIRGTIGALRALDDERAQLHVAPAAAPAPSS